jgi:Lon-like ATP-dependent protease
LGKLIFNFGSFAFGVSEAGKSCPIEFFFGHLNKTMKGILVKRIRSLGPSRFYSSKPPKKITPILKPKKEDDEEPIDKVKSIKDTKPVKEEASKELDDEANESDFQASQDKNFNRNSKASKALVRKFNRILPNLKIISAKVSIPTTIKSLLAIPLQRRPLFPGFYKSLYIKDPKVIKIIQDLMKNQQPFIGIFMSKDCEDDLVMNMNDVEKVGVFAQITNTYQTGPDNSLTVVVYPHRRIRMTDLSMGSKIITIDPTSEDQKDKTAKKDDPTIEQDHKMLQILSQNNAPIATIENLEDEKFSPENRLIKATTAEIITVFKELSQSNPLLRDQIITHNVQSNNVLMDPAKLADFAAALSGGEPHELQGILESLVVEERLHKSLVVLKKELANAKLQQEISQEVDRKISRKNQEYFLMEQLKGIKKELGLESDGKEKLLEKFRQKAIGLKMPENIKSVFDEEMLKLQGLEQQGSEFNVTRNYLDWLTQIPWGNKSLENYDLAKALEVSFVCLLLPLLLEIV